MIRGIRGATTVNANSEKEIIHETEKLLREMIDRNQLKSEEVASVLISVTEEITATFPAKAMRKIEGWKFVPVMCVREIPVHGSLPNCIRIMMHVNTVKTQKEICHVYLENAVGLRPDLEN
ncbi:chorismate mutase [Bacillus aquiflavi]|uniref:chorismate mutase n=1 Tax=Bacillus aquiflavi TaxID=2672567 RepID=A0A6B3VTC9_9BACI|nr:chorismate mutase [Bacillus aquiflavi]MBA4536084.1 chorismate mutase [Bacillus aquiflavi]NEY80458.1 chorismate mutase [Bacillus aquiflavi]UAC47070.1 chorismate mutase [Bacillus aquiflavi]